MMAISGMFFIAVLFELIRLIEGSGSISSGNSSGNSRLGSIFSTNKKIPAVTEINPAAYAGRWFQTHTSLYPYETFERNAFCITADYTPLRADLCRSLSSSSVDGDDENKANNDTGAGGGVENNDNDFCFSVFNSGSHGAPDGPIRGGRGLAYGNSQYPGELNVYMEGQSPFYSLYSYYWIVALSPLPSTDSPSNQQYQYQWAMISDPNRLYLFILARNISLFRSNGDEEVVLEEARKLGFSMFWNSPIESYQEKDCQYAPTSMSLFPPISNSKRGAGSHRRGPEGSNLGSLSEQQLFRTGAALSQFAKKHQLALDVDDVLPLSSTASVSSRTSSSASSSSAEQPMKKSASASVSDSSQSTHCEDNQHRDNRNIPFLEDHYLLTSHEQQQQQHSEPMGVVVPTTFPKSLLAGSSSSSSSSSGRGASSDSGKDDSIFSHWLHLLGFGPSKHKHDDDEGDDIQRERCGLRTAGKDEEENRSQQQQQQRDGDGGGGVRVGAAGGMLQLPSASDSHWREGHKTGREFNKEEQQLEQQQQQCA